MSEDINALWLTYKESGDIEARDSLLLHYTYLVKWLVKRMMPKYNSHTDYDDLVSCGVLGLIDAMDKFDLEHGVKFETYAVNRIRGEILDYMRSQDWAPPSLRKKISAINEAYEELERAGAEPPSEHSIAQALDMPASQVQRIMSRSHMFNLVSFEDALQSLRTSGEPQAPEESSPEDVLMEKETKRLLAAVIDTLSEKERLVVTLYYYEGLLLREIAEVMSVTESRVSQIHSRTLAKLRTRLSRLL
ncbi:MAG: FliA/WhiG family RNA polymerase sigma factor [Oscillospiraceae bacterium]|jgi:RNA polymerase sigma factor for flagellar operon FliA|nr:FliA/WhiG family RNA polymerase sigma factor [Oscillospiraceae bacterium]